MHNKKKIKKYIYINIFPILIAIIEENNPRFVPKILSQCNYKS